MNSMFDCCESLTSLDISNFDTKNVIYFDFMFYHCVSLTSIDVSNFDTSNAISISNICFLPVLL